MFAAISSTNNLAPDALSIWHKSLELTGNKPSYDNLRFISDLAYEVGGFASFRDIRMYVNDASGTGLIPFDSIHWNNPNATLITQSGTITKTTKKGYSTTGDSGCLLSKTFLNSALTDNRNDFACFWLWVDVENIGVNVSGISILSDTRGIISYPKYTATNGYMGYAGRVADFTQSDGLTLVGFEIVSNTIKFYRNNVELSSQSTNFGGFTDYHSEMIDLTINVSAVNTITSPGADKTVNAPVKIGGCFIYPPSLVNRTTFYNSLISYYNKVQNL